MKVLVSMLLIILESSCHKGVGKNVDAVALQVLNRDQTPVQFLGDKTGHIFPGCLAVRFFDERDQLLTRNDVDEDGFWSDGYLISDVIRPTDPRFTLQGGARTEMSASILTTMRGFDVYGAKDHQGPTGKVLLSKVGKIQFRLWAFPKTSFEDQIFLYSDKIPIAELAQRPGVIQVSQRNGTEITPSK